MKVIIEFEVDDDAPAVKPYEPLTSVVDWFEKMQINDAAVRTLAGLTRDAKSALLQRMLDDLTTKGAPLHVLAYVRRQLKVETDT